jgi:hypothetical protein
LKRDRLLLVGRTRKRTQEKDTQGARGIFACKADEGRDEDDPERAVRLSVTGAVKKRTNQKKKTGSP